MRIYWTHLMPSSRIPEILTSRKFDTVLPRKIYAMILVLVDERKPVNYLSLYLQQDCDPFTELPASVKNALMIYTRSQLPNYESDRTGI